MFATDLRRGPIMIDDYKAENAATKISKQLLIHGASSSSELSEDSVFDVPAGNNI